MKIERIGQVIRRFREAKDWTLEDLARAADIPVSTITKIEHGDIKNPSIEKIAKIAKALGVTVDNLISLDTAA